MVSTVDHENLSCDSTAGGRQKEHRRVRHLGGHATRAAYGGEPHAVLARRRREVVTANRGHAAAALDDLAQALAFATRAAARRAIRREADRERAQLAALLRSRAE